MVSAIKIIGYLFQFAGMAIMFFGLFVLINGIQKTVSYTMASVQQQASEHPSAAPADCDPETDDLCGVDFTQEGAASQAMTKRVYTFYMYLGAGLALLFLGVILRSTEEIADFFGGMASKNKKIKVGKPKWENPFWPPPG